MILGKGPKSRWASCNNGIQKVDHDHPRRSMDMLQRILTEARKTFTEKDIYQMIILSRFIMSFIWSIN